MGKFDGILLASDMDGTLLNDKHEIGSATVEALNYFTQNGGHFALATGRTRPATAAYRTLLPCNAPGVYLNGAIICDESTEKMVYMEGLDDRAKALAHEVMKEFPHIGIEVYLPWAPRRSRFRSRGSRWREPFRGWRSLLPAAPGP